MDTIPGPAAERTATARPGEEVLRLADGVQLIGQVPGSGYRVAPSLVRRRDGQTIQLTPLLYAVLQAVDGSRTVEQVAAQVGAATGRLVSPDDVRTLSERLRTIGLLRLADGSEPQLRRSDPLLGLRFRYVVSDPEVTRRVTAPFARLFHPVVVAVLLAAFLAVATWVLFDKGLASATHQAFDEPGLLLLVFAVTVVSAGFHEFGHASAARYGGATPGAMGTGLYLVWPAFYTDVTDSYRLDRGGRLRTDLGGLYFNAVVAVAMYVAWWVSGWDALLLVIATQILQMVRQLAPLVRFDGYHVLADLTGVPDLYQRIRPTLLGLVPGRRPDPAAGELRTWARVVVTAWVLVVVPILLGALLLAVVALPRLVGTALAGMSRQWQLLGEQLAAGDGAAVVVRLLSLVAIALPVLGVVYLLARLVRQVVAGTWRATGGRPVRRAVAAVVGAALVAGLAVAWWPHPDTYRPVQAYERGTLADAVPAVLGSGPGTASGLQEGRTAEAVTVWTADRPLPTADDPVLAVVMVPKPTADGATPTTADGSPAPTWVFPFDAPAPPGEGDTQALAVATQDGSVVYDVAFALVWADEGRAVNTNEAYALASCTGCAAVAVGFQVVLVVGQADVVVPQNIAVAVTYQCVDCVTYALAVQLVLTLTGPLSAGTMEQLDALWAEIAAFGEDLEGVPLDEIQARLTAFEAELIELVQSDPAAVPASRPGTSPAAPTSGAETSGAETSGAETSGAPAGSGDPGSSTSSGAPTSSASTDAGSAPGPPAEGGATSAPPTSGAGTTDPAGAPSTSAPAPTTAGTSPTGASGSP